MRRSQIVIVPCGPQAITPARKFVPRQQAIVVMVVKTEQNARAVSVPMHRKFRILPIGTAIIEIAYLLPEQGLAVPLPPNPKQCALAMAPLIKAQALLIMYPPIPSSLA